MDEWPTDLLRNKNDWLLRAYFIEVTGSVYEA